jgi:Variant SH3 domain
MRRARVVREYRAQYANPIRFAEGDIVTLGDRDDEWSDFAWTTTADGNAGWAPYDWLKPLGDGRAQALRDYCAQELDVDPDDEMDVLDDYGGWYWVTDGRRTAGWVPGACLEVVDDTPPPEYAADEISAAWIAYWTNGGQDNPHASDPYAWANVEVDWLEGNDPEKLWQVILDIYRRPDAAPLLGMLAAGPLENLLGLHGPAFIDRVESLAANDAQFAHALGGVWQFTMTDDIWKRVQAVSDHRGWDGIPTGHVPP